MKIVGAGRTDAGVHARGQAFHFDLYPNETIREGQNEPTDVCQKLKTSLNSMLEQDIRVYNLSPSPPPEIVTLPDGSERRHRWHVIYRAQKKLYTYRISLNPYVISTEPIHRYDRVHIDGNMDPAHLQRVLKHYEGTHDFRAFAGAIEANQRKDGIEHKDTVRTVYSVDLIDEGKGNYRIEIRLKGALYKMVRNMVGTAFDVCRGRADEEYMLQILHHSADEENGGKSLFVRKDNKCKPAPPEGLCLEKVYFEDDF
jgi:tRNA pseudouridine38-40 synthase